MATTPAQTGYASVNGLKLYYEIHGTGQPLVLLHGAFSAIGTSFGALLPELPKTRQVIAFELQGLGRTADIERPLSLEQMADDTAAALRQLGIAQADLFGYSMGASVALHVAIRHQQVEQHERRLTLAHHVRGLGAALDGLDLEAFILERQLKHLEDVRLVVHTDDQRPLVGRRSGS